MSTEIGRGGSGLGSVTGGVVGAGVVVVVLGGDVCGGVDDGRLVDVTVLVGTDVVVDDGGV